MCLVLITFITKEFYRNLSNFVGETGGCTASQIPNRLQNPTSHYRVQSSLPLISPCGRHYSTVHTLISCLSKITFSVLLPSTPMFTHVTYHKRKCNVNQQNTLLKISVSIQFFLSSTCFGHLVFITRKTILCMQPYMVGFQCVYPISLPG